LYRPILIVNDQLLVSGQGPVKEDGRLMQGRVGSDLDKDQGKTAARQVALTMLSTIITHAPKELIIKRIVKVLGMVNATPEFEDHPYVINGFSELFSEVFGEEHGIGVRSAVGMHLPQNIPVEIEAAFLLET
jgi:enamine deaminase RidA (YjgF/YER057c/UK114 family)